MPKYEKNIDLRKAGFPQRLRGLREAAHLSKSDLAERAGLTYRTIHDLELGKRDRSQEKTLILIAQSLNVSLDELFGPIDTEASALIGHPPRRFPLGIIVGIAVLVVLALAVGILWHQSCARAGWTLDKGHLVVRDELLNIQLWETPNTGWLVTSCMVSPWDSNNFLVGIGKDAPGGGSLLCLERASGDTIWKVEPDIDAIVRAFGPKFVYTANFSCKEPLVADLDGDSTPEVIAQFSHGKHFPFAICTVRHDGTLRAQYAHQGHINQLLVVDIDADGKDEIIGIGTNNNKAYTGATILILDDKHCSGASVDSLCITVNSESDSALVRTILPNYPPPYMELIQAMRLIAFKLQILSDHEGKTMFSIVVRGDDPSTNITVFLDSELRPIGAQPDDILIQKGIFSWPDSLKNGAGPGDQDWLDEWLSGYKRFETGKFVP